MVLGSPVFKWLNNIFRERAQDERSDRIMLMYEEAIENFSLETSERREERDGNTQVKTREKVE